MTETTSSSDERDASAWGDVTFVVPERSGWVCHMFGSHSGAGMHWYPSKEDLPNAFWRWMQFICFGNRWEREP